PAISPGHVGDLTADRRSCCLGTLVVAVDVVEIHVHLVAHAPELAGALQPVAGAADHDDAATQFEPDEHGPIRVRLALALDEADGTIVFNTGEGTVKGRNLRRAGYAAMCVDDERPPFSFVVVEGPVTLSDDMDELRRWATAIGGRYMGEHDAEAFGARNAVPGELVARLTPERVTSAKDVAD